MKGGESEKCLLTQAMLLSLLSSQKGRRSRKLFKGNPEVRAAPATGPQRPRLDGCSGPPGAPSAE